MKLLKNPWCLLTLRVVIGSVFVYAGAAKIGDPLAFADSIATFQVFPPQLINLVALTLPPFEILVGAVLISGMFRCQAAFGSFVLTGAFSLILIQAIFRGLEVDCGCFGSGTPSFWSAWISLGRNALILIGSWWLWRISRRAVEKADCYDNGTKHA